MPSDVNTVNAVRTAGLATDRQRVCRRKALGFPGTLLAESPVNWLSPTMPGLSPPTKPLPKSLAANRPAKPPVVSKTKKGSDKK